MVGIELRTYAIVHKMSNQHKTWMALGKTGRYLQLRSFTFVALHDLHSGPIQTLLAVVAIPKLQFLRSCLLL